MCGSYRVIKLLEHAMNYTECGSRLI